MKNSINYYKESIRKNVKSLRNKMSAEDVMSKSTVICSKLMRLKEFNEAKVIYAYMSINNEVSTLPVIEKLTAVEALGGSQAFRKLVLPRITADDSMIFCVVEDMGMLSPGMMNIPEPTEECEIFDKNIAPSLLLMPLVAFDRKCSRIGYGGGYYDRFIEKYMNRYGAFPGKKSDLHMNVSFAMIL